MNINKIQCYNKLLLKSIIEKITAWNKWKININPIVMT